MDDMEACISSPGYVHSREMYTHVGTVPRNQKQKKSCKGLKEKKKKKSKEGVEEEEEGCSRGKSQWKAEEYVQHSPLLSALSSLSLTSLDRLVPVSAASRPLPSMPPPSWASPVTSPTDPSVKTQEVFAIYEDALDADKSAREPLNMAVNGPKVASSQDLYVPMDRISAAPHSQTEDRTDRQPGVTGKQETKKLLNDLQENMSR